MFYIIQNTVILFGYGDRCRTCKKDISRIISHTSEMHYICFGDTLSPCIVLACQYMSVPVCYHGASSTAYYCGQYTDPLSCHFFKIPRRNMVCPCDFEHNRSHICMYGTLNQHLTWKHPCIEHCQRKIGGVPIILTKHAAHEWPLWQHFFQ